MGRRCERAVSLGIIILGLGLLLAVRYYLTDVSACRAGAAITCPRLIVGDDVPVDGLLIQ